MKLINWLDGKKTFIGNVVLFLAMLLDQVVAGFWGVSTTWMAPTIQTLYWFGGGLTGLGWGHKAIKAKVSDPS